MASKYDHLGETLINFIQEQKIFFTGTAGKEGRVNVSPKGMDTLRVTNDREVVWLNLTGSGNETAAHVLENQRMTLMFCSFKEKPMILRLYGKAKMIPRGSGRWEEYAGLFPSFTGSRQFFVLSIELVQTSCGFAVPEYTFLGERDTLTKWADSRGEEGIRNYWEEKNKQSLDGKPTGM